MVISIATLVLGLFTVPWVVARMPADYFIRDRDERAPPVNPIANAIVRALKNTLGAGLVGLGIAMLVLPGQGILTILIGLSLLSFPGKRSLERRILRLPGVVKVVAALRRRAGRPALILD